MSGVDATLTRALAALANARRSRRRQRALRDDPTLRILLADLVAARAAAGMTQHEVATREVHPVEHLQARVIGDPGEGGVPRALFEEADAAPRPMDAPRNAAPPPISTQGSTGVGLPSASFGLSFATSSTAMVTVSPSRAAARFSKR